MGLNVTSGLATNYTLNGTTTAALSGSITPAPLTITANNAAKTFDGVPFAGGNGVSYLGLVNGEAPTVLSGNLAFTGTSQGAVNVGNYTIIPLGLVSSNYNITFNGGTLFINPVIPVGVTIPPQAAALINAVAATIADGTIPPITDLGLAIPDLGADIALVEEVSPGSGAIFDGTVDPSTYIAFGSNTSGAPTFYQLLTAGSGTDIIFNGLVSMTQPPANVVQDFEDRL